MPVGVDERLPGIGIPGDTSADKYRVIVAVAIHGVEVCWKIGTSGIIY
jgi:hypothetical protein